MQAPKLQRRLGRRVSRSGRLWQKQTFCSSKSFPYFLPLRDWQSSSYHRWLMHTKEKLPCPRSVQGCSLPCTPSDPACFFLFHCVVLFFLACLPRTGLSTTSHGHLGCHRNVRDLFTERRKVSHHPPLALAAGVRGFCIFSFFACPMKASFRTCDDRLL